MAILLSGFLADKQVFMNALRSSPFMSPALVLHTFIFSCWGVVVSWAANTLPDANRLSRDSVSSFFITGFSRWFSGGRSDLRPSLRQGERGKQRKRGTAASP